MEAATAIGLLFRNVALDLTKQGIDKLPGDEKHTESAAAFEAPSAKKSLKVAGEHLNKVSKELIQNTEVIAIQRALLKACGGKEGTDVLIMMGEFIKNKPELANEIGRKLLPHFLTETHKKLLDFPAKTFKAIYRFWRKKLVPKSEARLARLAAQKKWRQALPHARAISGIKLAKKARRVGAYSSSVCRRASRTSTAAPSPEEGPPSFPPPGSGDSDTPIVYEATSLDGTEL